MPFYRGDQARATWLGMRSARLDGVVANADLSTLRRATENVSRESHATGWAWLQGDYLAYGWKPYSRLVAIVGTALATLTFAFGLGGLLGTPLIGWPLMLMSALGAMIAYRYLYQTGFPRFVVFDRARGLVHVPHTFSPRHDTIRWQDANVCILDEQAYLLGLRPCTTLYVVRPGWDFRRDGYPPLQARIEIDRISGHLHDGHSEAVWRFIVAFMTLPRDANPHLKAVEHGLQTIRDLDYGGDWDAMRQSRRVRHGFFGAFSRLNLSNLSINPDWLRRPDGRWRVLRPHQSNGRP